MLQTHCWFHLQFNYPRPSTTTLFHHPQLSSSLPFWLLQAEAEMMVWYLLSTDWSRALKHGHWPGKKQAFDPSQFSTAAKRTKNLQSTHNSPCRLMPKMKECMTQRRGHRRGGGEREGNERSAIGLFATDCSFYKGVKRNQIAPNSHPKVASIMTRRTRVSFT